MNADFGTIIILFFLIFGALEFAVVIIPAIVSSSVAGRRSPSRPMYDIPLVLTRPVPADHAARMKSWYFNKNDQYRYIRNFDLDTVPQVSTGYPGRKSALFRERKPQSSAGPEKDWKAINTASWAIQKANKAAREENYAVLTANPAIQQSGEEDMGWMDEIAELNQFRFAR